MSMAWMRMPGQTWLAAAAMFAVMWVAMMVPMMLPSLVPHLRRCRAVTAVVVSAGYFLVWALIGIAVFPIGAAVMAIEMERPALARLVPIAVALAVVIAGAFQFSAWKSRSLACCREAQRTPPGNSAAAWRHGIRLGIDCAFCCGNLMAILLVVGVMNVWVMAVVTAAITAERLAPAGEHVARAVGALAILGGLFLLVR